MEYVYGVFHNYIDNGHIRDELVEKHGLFRSKESAIEAIRKSDYIDNINTVLLMQEFTDVKLNLTHSYCNKDGSNMTFCEYAIAPYHLTIAGENRRCAKVYYIKKILVNT